MIPHFSPFHSPPSSLHGDTEFTVFGLAVGPHLASSAQSSLLLALHSGVTPGEALEIRWGARSQTQVGHVQGQSPNRCTLSRTLKVPKRDKLQDQRDAQVAGAQALPVGGLCSTLVHSRPLMIPEQTTDTERHQTWPKNVDQPEK